MKKITKFSANYFWFALALSITLISGCSCSAPKPTPDPLVGFHFSSLDNLRSNKPIMDDCQDFIQTLPPEGKKVTGPSLFYEDEKGGHAVKIEVFIGGTASWTYVLIYDKENKRTQAIKYHYNKYQS